MSKSEAPININKKPYIVLFLAISILLFIVLVYAVNRDIQYVRVQRELTEKFVVRTGSDILQDALGTTATDLFFLSDAIQDILDANFSEEETLIKTKSMLTTFADFKPEYSQFRLINIEGEQILQVLGGYATSNVNSAEFNYTSAEFFTKTIDLPEGYMYVSDFDLESNDSVVNSSDDTTLRYCTPIYSQNKLVGILVVNARIDYIFEKLDNLANEFDTNIDLLNPEGYWMSTTTSNLEFGFRYPQHTKETFSNIYPEEWRLFVRTPIQTVTQSVTNNGLFTYSKLDLSTLISTNVDHASKIIFEVPSVYLTAYTLQDSGYYKIFIDSPIENIGYTIKTNYFYILLILLVSLLSTVLFYYRGLSIKKIQFHSDFDSLTSTYNRRAGMNIIKTLLNSGNSSHLPLSICVLDVNGLKEVNDTLGHQYGDELIVTASAAIKKNIRSNDILMRIGGDEFVLVLMNCPASQAEGVWGKIEESLKFINENKNRPFNISLSCGITEYNYSDASELDNVLVKTDKLMYENKKKMKETFSSIKKDL